LTIENSILLLSIVFSPPLFPFVRQRLTSITLQTREPLSRPNSDDRLTVHVQFPGYAWDLTLSVSIHRQSFNPFISNDLFDDALLLFRRTLYRIVRFGCAGSGMET
jgi:hypothetical protein